ncbi:MAG TPA: hypothetical protein VHQ90_16310 [Thermoanaerobaculia bacterium]|nr:hypothetical protein [Thermoanaerobaculia bacterium]
MNLSPLLAMAALAAVLGFLGSRFSPALAGPGESAVYRVVAATLAGTLVFHLLLTLLDLVGIAWRPVVLAAALALVCGACGLAHAAASRRRPPRAGSTDGNGAGGPGRRRLGWGDAVALAGVLVFALLAWKLWIVTPDFVYHWGLKGHRFFLAQGVDYTYLARGWNWVIHPDYPNLLPELYAATALLGGSFAAPAMMLWSVLFFALLLAACREALRLAAADRFLRQAGLALIAAATAAFAINTPMAGGADWMIALALAAALPPLLRPRDRVGDLGIGVIAAFAAASKVEGLALGVFLIGAQWARAGCRPPAPNTPTAPTAPNAPKAPGTAVLLSGTRAAAALLLPAAAVVAPWLAEVHRHHLFLAFNSGPFDLARVPRVAQLVWAMMRGHEWHGFAFALLLAPLLPADRRLRPIAAVIALQLAFYLYVYCSARVDPTDLIQTSFGRLTLHVVPAILAGAVIAAARWTVQSTPGRDSG